MLKRSILLSVLLVFVLIGCQTVKKLTPEEAINAQIQKFAQALKAGDIDGVMSIFSEKFEHYEWGTKAGAREFLQQAKDAGYLEGLDIDVGKVQIKVEGNKATAYPVEVFGNFGSTTVEFVFTNEDGNWLVTGLDASDI